MNSLVSVIMPTYNYGKYISEAIDSVLNQTYTDFEIIVADDGSTDDTRMVIERFMGKCPGKIRYFYQKNKGPGAARNFAIGEAKGEYVAFLDADDLWLPDKLKLQMEMFEKMPDIGFIHTNYKLFCSDGEISNYRFGITSPVQLSGDIFPYLLRECVVRTSGAIIKKKCLDDTGLFEETFSGEDYEFWLRVAKKFKAGYVRLPVLQCREHPEHALRRDAHKAYANVRRVIDKTLENFPEVKNDPRCRESLKYREAKICYEIGYAHFLKKEIRLARDNFYQSLKNKFTLTSLKYFLLAFIAPAIIDKAKNIKKNLAKAK